MLTKMATSTSVLPIIEVSRCLKKQLKWARIVNPWRRDQYRLLNTIPRDYKDYKVHIQTNSQGKRISYAFTSSPFPLDSLTLGQHLSKSAQRFPQKTALISSHEGISWSFQDVNTQVTRVANAISSELGVKRGDVIALWSSNSATNIVIQYAAARLGLIMCTLNPAYREDELRFALQESGAKAIFLPGKLSRQESVNRFWDVLISTDVKGLPLKYVVALDGQLSDTKEGLNFLRLDELQDNAGKVDAIDESFASDAASIIMFTSGTTGRPKGAVLSHYNMVNNARFVSHRLSLDISEAVSCIPVPLFHVFGMVYGSVMMSVASVPIVLTGYRYNAKDVIKGIQSNKCTHAMIVPAMTVDIVKVIESTKEELPSLKYIITGSAPTPPELASKAIATFPKIENFYIRYGSTETGGCMTMPFPYDDPHQGIEGVGAPLDLTEVKICNRTNGDVVPIEEEGEVWVRGHHVMLGYWRRPDKTAEAIENGWFKTGDMGVMNEQGYISLKGRTKEMIIRGGENIYPKEIENLLHQHPSVEEAHVCGVPDERVGEEVCAWVHLKDSISGVTVDDIRSFCKERISYFKVPRYVLFVNDFPRTPKGSAQKHVMTEKSCHILGLQKLSK